MLLFAGEYFLDHALERIALDVFSIVITFPRSAA
jgi:hypothetical protein